MAMPSSNSTQKILSLFWGKFEGDLFFISIELRRFLASLEMTGYENHFFLLPLGKSWKGGRALVPILGDPSQKAFGTTLRVGSKEGLFPLPNILRPFA